MLLDREYCMEHNIVSGRRDVLSEVWAKFTLLVFFYSCAYLSQNAYNSLSYIMTWTSWERE